MHKKPLNLPTATRIPLNPFRHNRRHRQLFLLQIPKPNFRPHSPQQRMPTMLIMQRPIQTILNKQLNKTNLYML